MILEDIVIELQQVPIKLQPPLPVAEDLEPQPQVRWWTSSSRRRAAPIPGTPLARARYWRGSITGSPRRRWDTLLSSALLLTSGTRSCASSSRSSLRLIPARRRAQARRAQGPGRRVPDRPVRQLRVHAVAPGIRATAAAEHEGDGIGLARVSAPMELRLTHESLTRFPADLGIRFEFNAAVFDPLDPSPPVGVSAAAPGEAVAVHLPLGSGPSRRLWRLFAS
ncbi:scarecrow-like protein 6 [Panicum miliaceum]|uniref:Scarecrow-like protein 6 n=1 Tax=Panicum miliaceum TaxID=4540 RepID=A0A3L6TT22_PANMI|nr:scarecrow-like protein 6 [Panicum miliaceum]